jgi:PAS domain S-box-containing protein
MDQFLAGKGLRLDHKFDILPCGNIFVSGKGKIEEVNQFVCNLTGYSKSELRNNKSIFDLFTIGSKIYYETHLVPIVKFQGYANETYFSFLSKDGKNIPVLMNAQILNDDHNSAIGTLFAVFAFSQRTIFEEELVLANKKNKLLIEKLKYHNKLTAEKNKLIRGLLKEAPIAVYSFQMDAAGVMTVPYYNDVFALMFPDSIEKDGTIDAGKMFKRIHPDDEKGFMNKIIESYQQLTIFAVSVKIFDKDQNIRCIKIISHPTKREAGIVMWKGSIEDITEKTVTDQQLRRSEAFNRGVLNSLSSNISVIDAAGNIVAVNESWNRFSINNGETSLQKTGNGANYYSVLENAAKAGFDTSLDVLKGIKNVMAGEASTFNFEYPCNSPEEERWFSMNVVKLEDNENNIVIAHENITERKLAEERVQLSNEKLQVANSKYEEILNNSNDLIYTINGNGEIDFVNQQWIDKLGYSIGNCLGKKTTDFIHPDYIDRFTAILKSIEAEEKIVYPEIGFISSEGKKIFTKATFVCTYNNKKLEKALGFFKDITEKKEKEFLLLNTLDNINEGYCFANKDLIILDWNNAAEELTVLKRSALIGKNLFEIFSSLATSNSVNQLFNTIQLKGSGREDIYNIFLDKWFCIKATSVNEGYAFFISDISESKRVEGLLKLEKDIYSSFAINSEVSIKQVLLTVASKIKEVHPQMIFSTLQKKDDCLYNWVSPDLPDEYISAIDGVEIKGNIGPCSTAAYTKENVIAADIATGKFSEKYKAIAEKFNLKSCWSFSLIVEKTTVVGTFAIYHQTVRKIKNSQLDSIERVKNLIQHLIELKTSQEEKQQSENLRNRIIDASVTAIIITKKNGDIILFNPVAQKMFGWNAREAIDKNLFNLLMPSEVKELQITLLEKIIDEEKTTHKHQEIELLGLHKNQTQIPVEVMIAPIVQDGKDLFVYFVKDISTFKKQLNVIKVQNEKLREISWMQSHIVRAPLAKIMSIVSHVDAKINKKEKEDSLTDLLDLMMISAKELDAVVHEISDKASQIENEMQNELMLEDDRMNDTETQLPNRKMNILLVDDDPGITMINELMVVDNGLSEHPLCFKNGKLAFDFLVKSCPQDDFFLVYLDINMPVMDGWHFLEALQQCSCRDRVFVIMLSSSSDNRDKQKAFTFPNVIDFFEKPLSDELVNLTKSLDRLIPFLKK